MAKMLLMSGRLIIGLRAKRLWGRVDLSFCRKVKYLNNPQSSYISPGNMDPGLFEEVKLALRGHPEESPQGLQG
jgi:hypothetical protein